MKWRPLTMPVMVPSAVVVSLMSCSSQTSDVMLRQRMIAAFPARRVKERVEPWRIPVAPMSWIQVSMVFTVPFHSPQPITYWASRFWACLKCCSWSRCGVDFVPFWSASAADSAKEPARSACLKNSYSSPALSRAARGAPNAAAKNSSISSAWPQASSTRLLRMSRIFCELEKPCGPVIAAVGLSSPARRIKPTSSYLTSTFFS
mmetsp:Transcript_61861/g.149021  ORF Transcript_61861/g.149021 Transcript_61861/m.149021 type:complete len:204 (+) Transcript_61861:297-908(+)